ncbi:hypothetical protein GW17_00023956 [Ensete ventricosum]|nr:hypothetical protein GW17_00023956 [Ensete ventricosum]
MHPLRFPNTKATRKGVAGHGQASIGAASHGQATYRGGRPWPSDKACRRWAAATRRGDACGQKLPPTRAAAHRNAYRGDAHGGAACGRDVGRKGSNAHPLVGRMSAGKGSRRLRKGDDGSDAMRVREEG